MEEFTMKNRYFLYLSLLLCISLIDAMELPEKVTQEQVQSSEKISVINPVVIEPEFGKNYDYSSILNPDCDLPEAEYKRRLKIFKNYLFDYLEGMERTDMHSGSALDFIQTYLYLISIIKESAESLPLYNKQPIVDFIPEKALSRNYKKIKIPAGYITIGTSVKKQGNEVSISPQTPVYVITDPDAESMCLLFSELNAKKLNPLQKTSLIVGLWQQQGLSEQATRVMHCYVYGIAKRLLNDLVNTAQEKKKIALESPENKTVRYCIFNCPHLLKLTALQERLLRSPQDFLGTLPDDTVGFIATVLPTFIDLHNYAAKLPDLCKEYATIYDRIKQELKAFKKKNKEKTEKVKPAEIPAIKPVPAAMVEKPLPAKITYSKRVTQWFKDGFIKKKKNREINYHTLLPMIADRILIQHGQISDYLNKSYKGEIDTLYRIAGKIEYEDKAKDETYCVFNICIDQQDICYHRECKKCTWEKLAETLKNEIFIEDDAAHEADDVAIVEQPEQKAAILKETNAYAVIYNPMHKCKITLYKKQI